MSSQCFRGITILSLSALVSAVATNAVAQVSPAHAPHPSQTHRYESVQEVFERAFFNESGNFYENRSPRRQADVILGTGGAFVENEIAQDAQLVNILYRDLLEQQVSSGPTLRTPDLANPFATSLRQNPGYRAFSPAGAEMRQPFPGTEFLFPVTPGN